MKTLDEHKKQICPSCKGKGHVFEAASLLLLINIFLAPFERNNPNGMTREECFQCRGNGYVIW